MWKILPEFQFKTWTYIMNRLCKSDSIDVYVLCEQIALGRPVLLYHFYLERR